MSAYFHEVLRKLHRQTKEELTAQGIKIPKRGRKELDRINKELRKGLI